MATTVSQFTTAPSIERLIETAVDQQHHQAEAAELGHALRASQGDWHAYERAVRSVAMRAIMRRLASAMGIGRA